MDAGGVLKNKNKVVFSLHFKDELQICQSFYKKVKLVSSFHCRPAGGLRFNCCPSLWQQWTGESYSIRFFEGSVSFLKVDIAPHALVPGVCNISNSGNPVSSSKRQCAMWSKLDQI